MCGVMCTSEGLKFTTNNNKKKKYPGRKINERKLLLNFVSINNDA